MSIKKQHKQTDPYDVENPAEIDKDIIDGCEASSKESSDAKNTSGGSAKAEKEASDTSGDAGALRDEVDALKKELADKTNKCDEYLDKLQRTAAEFDNYKRRSVKEKEALYIDAVSDVVSAFLPVIDNVERALKAISEDSTAQTLKKGVEMVFEQFRDTLGSIGVEEIKALNETFDPMLHNAVMHVDDDTYGHNEVIEEFQKGYKYKDKVIRYSMVKVAN